VFAVPDALVLKVLVERLSQLDCVSRGYILHGYPLSREQAEQLAAAGHTPNRYADHFPSSSLHFPHFLFSNFPHFLNFPFSSFPIFLISHFPHFPFSLVSFLYHFRILHQHGFVVL
jgi:hypothetical protein